MEIPEFKNRHDERIDASYHDGGSEGRLVIFGHGVTAHMDRPLSLAMAKGLEAAGWSVLRISFTGNGESGGRFEDSTVSKECEDLKSVIDQLPAGIRVAYCGHSMGGAVGVKSAIADPRIEVLVSLAGMVRTKLFCDTEFGDVRPDEGNMWDENGCPLSSTYVKDMHAIGDLLAEAGQVRQPWLLVHGTEDDVVLPADSRDAHASAPGPKRLVEIEGAGHVFDEQSYGTVIAAIDEWLGEHFA
ncbi:MAG: alpha/beta hydrolase [Verrucomicrobiota bacterium]